MRPLAVEAWADYIATLKMIRQRLPDCRDGLLDHVIEAETHKLGERMAREALAAAAQRDRGA